MKNSHPLSIAVLSIFMALHLSGCENEDYAAIDCSPGSAVSGVTNCASENQAVTGDEDPQLPEQPQEPTLPPQAEYQNKGGVTGQVVGASYWEQGKICFDTNQNGLCDIGSEPVEVLWSEGRFSFAAEAVATAVENKTLLLAINEEGATKPVAMYAPAPETSTAEGVFITPFTTLVVSETQFNPNTLSSFEAARSALATGTPAIGNAQVLLGSDHLAGGEQMVIGQAAAIAASLAQSQNLLASHHFQGTAAVINQIYRSGDLEVTTVLLAAIEALEPLGDSVVAELLEPALTWGLGHADEISGTIDARNELAVVGSKWRNRLIVINTSGAALDQIGLGDFAEFPGGERDEVDAVTGATEQVLEKVQLTPDAVSAIVGVGKYKKESAERGVGLYRANLSQPTLIPAHRFGVDMVNTVDFFAFADFNDFALSADGSKIVLAGEDKRLVALTNQTFSEDFSLDFTSKVRAVGIDSTGGHAFAALFGARTGLATVDISTGTEVGFMATGSQYPEKIVTFANDTRMGFYLRKGKTLFIYNIENPASPQLILQLEGSEKMKTFAFSGDGKFAVAGIVGGIVEVYALESGQLISEFVTEKDALGVSKSVNDIAFTDNSRALVSIKNGVQVLNIEVVPPKEWSEADKQVWFDQHRKPL